MAARRKQAVLGARVAEVMPCSQTRGGVLHARGQTASAKAPHRIEECPIVPKAARHQTTCQSQQAAAPHSAEAPGALPSAPPYGPTGPARGYLSTSSAWKRMVGGIVRPRASAVLRLMISSNFVGCSTG